jgi:hypothetical protein
MADGGSFFARILTRAVEQTLVAPEGSVILKVKVAKGVANAFAGGT